MGGAQPKSYTTPKTLRKGATGIKISLYGLRVVGFLVFRGVASLASGLSKLELRVYVGTSRTSCLS